MAKASPKRTRRKTPPTFMVGDQVRVKHGTMDYEYPDLPIGGWTGDVKEVYDESPPTYLIRWNQQTIDSIHPVYKNRCERDGLAHEEMVLEDGDLLPATDEAVEIDRPTNIQTKPLDLRDQEDRLRAIFGFTHDDLLPCVNCDALRVFRSYLATHLSFPFEAIWTPYDAVFRSSRKPVVIVGLGNQADEAYIDQHYGLICQVKIGKKSRDAPLADIETKQRGNRQLVSDYRFWFANH